jgi:DNA modification methylase
VKSGILELRGGKCKKMDKKSVRPLEELLDSVRDIDGFPIGKDEDILALSDPPFYTACPNPYIKQFIEEYGKPYDPDNDEYERTPFVGDVSEGKNDPIYKAHSYHTKVPHKAIMKYIEHYTEEGDIVFDGFCGTGMTGVAAQLLNRKAILSELSPAATFIAYNYNTPVDAEEFEREANRILEEVEQECGWMYETSHVDDTETGQKILSESVEKKGKINYTVWSDVFICPYCQNEYVFWSVAVDKENGKVKKSYSCPSCAAILTKNECERVAITFFDSGIAQEVTQAKEVPVLINYSIGRDVFEKRPDSDDLTLIEKIKPIEIPYWFPTTKLLEGDKTAEPYRVGITHLHHFYTKRALYTLSKIFDLLFNSNIKTKKYLVYTFEQVVLGMAKISRYAPTHYSQVNQYLSGTLYIGSQRVDVAPRYILGNKIKRLKKVLKMLNSFKSQSVLVSNQSMTNFRQINKNRVDYIFTDPPFGGNLMYSELNFLWEAWLKVFTNNTSEAIMNNTQQKGLDEYRELMTACFKEYYRLLKPNRWITVEFHNSQASVWNAIQEAMAKSGFIIAQVAVLDKQHGTFNQVSTSGAVKNDLIINAYKPKTEFSERFLKNAGEGMEVDFVSQQLEHLPIRPNIERNEKMLYSKMLAHYVENGFKIQYDSTNFYKLLLENFTELDGYWFLDRKVKEYNEWKSGLSLDQMKKLLSGQQVLFVTDEKSALTWMYHFLNQPRSYSEIYTAYQQVATITDDAVPEPKELLDNNFILEDGKYRRPISQEEKESTNKNRDRELDHAFNKLLRQAKEQKGKIQNVRREALVHGFTKCYQEGRYQDILTIANKLLAKTLEASGDIMDFVDIARIKTAGEKEAENNN